jgi:hypothetical protein
VERRVSSCIDEMGICGVALWSLDGGRMLRCARREDESSSPMVASSTGMENFMWILTLKMAWRFDGGEIFCSV